MLILICILILGSGVAYVAIQNTTPVTFTILQYTFPNIPLYLVIIGSLLTGCLLIYVIHLIDSVVTAFTLHGKDKKIKESERNVADLTKRIHKLELENEALKQGDPSTEDDDKAL